MARSRAHAAAARLQEALDDAILEAVEAHHREATGGGQQCLGSGQPFVELVELAVLPDTQGHGIGAALLEALLAARPEPHVLLHTVDQDTPAMRLYLRAGFSRAVETGTWVVLAKELH